MDYAQLTGSSTAPGSIARWVSSSIIQNDTPEIVTEAESFIYRRLRHFKMLTDPLDGTMTIGQDFVTAPSDLLEPFLFWITGAQQAFIVQKTPQDVIASWQYTGTGTARVQQQPQIYYQGETTLRFDSPPDQAYPYSLIYFQQPAPLATTNTNFLTVTYPRLLRYVCMAAACEWMKDAGQGNFDRTYWDQLAQDEIDKAQTESDRAKRGTVAGMILIGGANYGQNYPAYAGGYG